MVVNCIPNYFPASSIFFYFSTQWWPSLLIDWLITELFINVDLLVTDTTCCVDKKKSPGLMDFCYRLLHGGISIVNISWNTKPFVVYGNPQWGGTDV